MHRLISFTYIYLIPLSFSAIFSLRSFRLKWPKHFRLFSVFLLSTTAVEAFAIAWKWGLCQTAYWHYHPSNLWIYNAFTPIRHLFLLTFFYPIITYPNVRRIIRISVIPFIAFAVWDYVDLQTPHEANTYTVILANTITVLMSMTFFIQLLEDKRVISLPSSSEVWIAFGAFLYYSATLPLFIFFNYLFTAHLTVALSYLYINDALNIVMYTFYLISFLCKPQYLK